MRWTRIVGLVLAGMVTVVLVVIVGGVVWLRTSAFQNYALRKISGQTYASTGAKTDIGALALSLSTLTARLDNITMRGAEGANQAPLLHVDSLTVGLNFKSALHGRITLKELLINHPVVHLAGDRAGKMNLPQPPPTQNPTHTSIFDLAVGHLRLTHGEIDYNDQKLPMEADVHNLGTDIRFDPSTKRYSGSLSYTEGQLLYANYRPLPHQFNARFSATPERFSLEPAVLKVGSTEMVLRAVLSSYSTPLVDGDYELRIHTQDFAALSPSVRPAGDVLLSGKLHYQSSEKGSLLTSISTEGQIASETIRAGMSRTAIEARRLQGHYRLANATLRVSNLKLETLGGTITSEAEAQHLNETPSWRVRATLHGISLRAAQKTLNRPELKGTAISGALNGTAEAFWVGSIDNARARADATVQAAVSGSSNGSEGEIPVTGAIHGAYDGSRKVLTLTNTELQVPSATVAAHGQLSSHSHLQLQLTARNLHQLEELAAAFSSTPHTLPAVSGSASFTANISGSMNQPEISGQLHAQNLAVQGSEWTTARLELHASPSQLAIRNGVLVNARKGQALFEAQVGLRRWSYQPSSPLQANLSIHGLQVNDLQRLANEHYPVSGELSAKLSLRGSQLNPIGSGSAQLANARVYDEILQDLSLNFNAQHGTVVSTLKLAAPAGEVKADVSYAPKSKAYRVRLDAPAIVLQKVGTLKGKSLPLTGTMNASVNGEGTLDNPQLTATVRLPELGVREKRIGALKADVRIANHQAEMDVESNVAQASVKVHGQTNLSGGYYSEAAVDTGTIPLNQLMATYGHGAAEGLQGQAELHASLKGPLKDKSRIEAHLSIPALKATYQALEIGIANPIRADYSNSVVRLQPVEIRGSGTSLHVQGSMPLGGNAAPNLTAQGTIDVRVLRILAPDVTSSGLLAVDVRSSGTAKAPTVQGQIHVKDVAFAASEAPLGVQKLNGTLDIGNDRVQISNVSGQVGGGQVSIGGSIAYRPNIQFNVALQGESIRLRYPEGLRTLLDTRLVYSGTTQASALKGRVLIDSVTFASDFDLAKLSDQFSTETEVPSQPTFADTIKLAINVQSKQSLSATSSQVSIGGTANLQVGGTAANPVVTGRTSLTSGELFFRNVRYELQRGIITLDDPNQTHPVMNVSVTTTVEHYNLTLTLRGALDKLTVSYVSDPPLATADIINLIARGKTTQEANATSQSTDSIIASGAAGELTSSVQKLAGISSLQIDPLLGGSNQNPSARVAIQQRVSKNLLFTFSTDVSQPGTEVVQGEYQINKRWSASVTRDQLGGVSVDGKYHTRF